MLSLLLLSTCNVRAGCRVDYLHKSANHKETSGLIAAISDCNIIAVACGAGAALVAFSKRIM